MEKRSPDLLSTLSTSPSPQELCRSNSLEQTVTGETAFPLSSSEDTVSVLVRSCETMIFASAIEKGSLWKGGRCVRIFVGSVKCHSTLQALIMYDVRSHCVADHLHDIMSRAWLSLQSLSSHSSRQRVGVEDHARRWRCGGRQVSIATHQEENSNPSNVGRS